MNDFTHFRNQLTWRLFLLTGGVCVFGCVITLLAQTLSGGLRTGALLALVAGLLLSGGVSVLVARLIARQSQDLTDTIRSSTEPGMALRVEPIEGGIFAEVASAWHRALEALTVSRFQQQSVATAHYKSLTEFMGMMAKAVDERTSYLRGHAERVSTYAVEIARELSLDPEQVERVRLSALLHDIGTLGVDDSIVTKDSPLTPEEFEIVKAHTVKGASILRTIESLSDLIPGVELHHESLDGHGYPYGLRGDEIPMMPRIIAVADSFDAMTTMRPYQPAMDPEYVLEVMTRLAGTRYDPDAVRALTRVVAKGAIRVSRARPALAVRQKSEAAGVS